MKYCPTCRTQYTDNSLRFCLQDGATLVEQLAADTPTVAFPETPTVVAKRAETHETSWRNEPVTEVSAASQTRRSGIFWPLAVLGIVVIGLFAIVGVAVGAYMWGKSGVSTANANTASNGSNTNGSVGTKPGPYFPTPIATATPISQPSTTVTPPPFPTPPPTTDKEQARRDVSQSIYGWKSMAEARDLNAYMGNYAETIDYYRKPGSSRSSVRADKARAFGMYDSMRVNISNMNVSLDESGYTATAIFDKEWDFRGSRNSTGKVQQQLKLRNENGRWLITGEHDLRVYYVN